MSRQVEASAGGATACPDDELLVPVPITIYLGPGASRQNETGNVG